MCSACVPVSVDDLAGVLVLPAGEADLIHHLGPPLLHLDHASQVPDVGLELEELVPDVDGLL